MTCESLFILLLYLLEPSCLSPWLHYTIKYAKTVCEIFLVCPKPCFLDNSTQVAYYFPSKLQYAALDTTAKQLSVIV